MSNSKSPNPENEYVNSVFDALMKMKDLIFTQLGGARRGGANYT